MRPKLVHSVRLLFLSTVAVWLAGCRDEVTGTDRTLGTFGTSLLGSYDAKIVVEDVVLSPEGGKLYVGGRRGSGPSAEFQVLDLTDPLAPRLLGGWRSPEPGADVLTIELSDATGIAYVGYWDRTLRIIDVSSAASPRLLGTHRANGRVSDIALSPTGDMAYLATGDSGLQVVDVSNPSSPRLLSTVDVSAGCSIDGEPVFAGNCSAVSVARSTDASILYVSSWWAGIKILNATEPASPELLTSFEISHAGREITAGKVILSRDGRKAYVTSFGGSLTTRDSSTGGQVRVAMPSLVILDLTNPRSPAVLGTYANEFGGYNHVKLSADESRVYVGGINLGLEILAVTEPTTPRIIGRFQEVIDNTAPAVSGFDIRADQIAYVAQDYHGLRIVDVARAR